MALDFNNDFKTSLLSNYHNFVPKIVLSDRASVKNTISPTLNEINIEPTSIERDGAQQETKHLFSSVTEVVNSFDVLDCKIIPAQDL